MRCLNVALAERSYPIYIGAGLLGRVGLILPLLRTPRIALVSNTTVAPLYMDVLVKALEKEGVGVTPIILADGEAHKNWQSLNLIYDALLASRCDRGTTILALGGGVIGDLAGFAAATYQRGVPFVQVPTTLLAQVDSSVGGKTGINHPMGKNMIGAFYQPLKVVCDLDTLKTLPLRELSAGLAEVIKYGPIADLDFLQWIEENIDALLAREPLALAYAVRRCCEIKAWVVAQDERESGLRAILNFGHTFGHAIEAGLGYGEWLHGEAVGCGMVMAMGLSHRLGLVDASDVQRVTALIEKAGLPVLGPCLSTTDNAGRYLELMQIDKKAQDGEVRFVLIDGAARAFVRGAPEALVREVIDACCLRQ